LIKIAYWFDAPCAYSGGLNYIANLLHAISSTKKSGVKPYVFFASDVPENVLNRFEGRATIVLTSILRRNTLPWMFHKLLYHMFGSMWLVNQILKKYDIDLVSHIWTPYLGRRTVKVIAWIPDFQYLHLPGMFPDLDIKKESKYNVQIAKHADAVIVSSEHAKSDLLTLVAEQDIPPLHVLRFVSQPFMSADLEYPSLSSLEEKYCFKGKFFLLPNQFWAHKNHEIVIEALVIARREGQSLTVLMTGNTIDYRLSGTPYIDGIRNKISIEGLEENVHILGLIEYGDLLALMRYCVGVINPSRFEGWSSSVEEAKSMGKPVLLSAIPVHIEQTPMDGSYFELDDPNGLKDLMIKLWSKNSCQSDYFLEQGARLDLARRTKKFGTDYLEIIYQVMNAPAV
jgi:glycosyltransferase involved in cell wall biosynthesis